ncbi:hypothetical protein DFH09DRAFT_1315970 [Mycena vulgaris]|nr:hypothetical protein DFH09DRAFT_1315970 [Mycena vulgaris]
MATGRPALTNRFPTDAHVVLIAHQIFRQTSEKKATLDATLDGYQAPRSSEPPLGERARPLDGASNLWMTLYTSRRRPAPANRLPTNAHVVLMAHQILVQNLTEKHLWMAL